MILEIDSKSKKIYLQFKKIVQLERTLKLFQIYDKSIQELNSSLPSYYFLLHKTLQRLNKDMQKLGTVGYKLKIRFTKLVRNFKLFS